MKQTKGKVVLVGAGNLATQLGKALKEAGIEILQIYSRTRKSAEELALQLGCESTDSLTALRKDAHFYIFSVKDAVLESLIREVSKEDSGALFLHTAGSIPMEVFRGRVCRYGVLYPLQTFSKKQKVSFAEIPCFIEGSSAEVIRQLRYFAECISTQVYELDSEKRRILHLAAVFSCNFTNHLFALSEDILKTSQIPFSVLFPLIQETVQKVQQMPPAQAQTGPALRYDRNVIEAQLDLLKESPLLQEIYQLLSRSIYEKNKQ